MRALPIVALIFARFRMMPGSCMSASVSASSMAATRSMSKSWNAIRKVGRRRRIVIQESPAWNPSRLSFSKSGRSPCNSNPHSSS